MSISQTLYIALSLTSNFYNFFEEYFAVHTVRIKYKLERSLISNHMATNVRTKNVL